MPVCDGDKKANGTSVVSEQGRGVGTGDGSERHVEQRLYQQRQHTDHKERLEELITYVVLALKAFLWEEEVLMLSLKGLCHFWDETSSQADPYIMATRYDRFKDESGYYWHFSPISDLTCSGIPCRL